MKSHLFEQTHKMFGETVRMNRQSALLGSNRIVDEAHKVFKMSLIVVLRFDPWHG